MPIGHTHTHAPANTNQLFLLFLFSFELECARKQVLLSHVITYSSIIAHPDARVNVSLFFVILLLLRAESIAFAHGCIEPMLERCCARIFFSLHSSFFFWHNPNGCVVASSSSSTSTFCAPVLSLSPSTADEMQLHGFCCSFLSSILYKRVICAQNIVFGSVFFFFFFSFL